MGVPKFYRWISERYPCLSEVIKEYQIPEFDNLYLDMNGIIHVCSHPNDEDPHFRITEEKIFADICHYLDFLFKMIKPRKVFFMAVDGVAPRAKMNQQRGRRFRTARDATLLEQKARECGENLPTEARFDSNCITPGTQFMVRLHSILKSFVEYKISSDKLWQNVKVYLSGHETPGEGEHKIMDFIRYEKSQKNYDPNTRHCLYGLDADLIMLGLCSHEPHFSLLREEVRFGKKANQKRIVTPEETTFHLLHLSLLREYLEYEFAPAKSTIEFEFETEKVIDDFVLMSFLVGNDFIPHLPQLHIHQDALPTLFQSYIEVLPSLGGYINEGGFLNLERFEKFFKKLADFDYSKFSEVSDFAPPGCETKSEIYEEATNSCHEKLANLGFSEESLNKTTEFDSESDNENSDSLFELEFEQHKRDYYRNKLGFENVTEEVLRDQAEGYVRAIQWNLHYYYHGVPSWGWYYPHHYAPYISDVKDFKNMNLEFAYGKPFLPFQQLLAVLPSLSKELLPLSYQKLMVCETSPMIDFYPLDFETDLNGKKQDWEAVVLIPFIQEDLLLKHAAEADKTLTAEERHRNRHGPHLLYTYNKKSTVGFTPSFLPQFFPPLDYHYSKCQELDEKFFRMLPNNIKKGLCSGVKLDVHFPGFPTLKHVKHTAKLCNEDVKVFQMISQRDNMMLTVTDIVPPDLEKVANSMLGKIVHVGWPHLVKGYVIMVSNEEETYKWEDSESMKTSTDANLWHSMLEGVKENHFKRLGIILGDVNILVHAKCLTGSRLLWDEKVMEEIQWTERFSQFPYKTVLKDLEDHCPEGKVKKSCKDLYPMNSPVFMLGSPYYGCMGTVSDNDAVKNRGSIIVKFDIPEEPDMKSVIRNRRKLASLNYVPGYTLAQHLGISGYFLSRLTGTLLIQTNSKESISPNKVNVGLNLKFNKKNEEVAGYSKKTEDNQWLYSNQVFETLEKYLSQFPDFFEALVPLAVGDMVYLEDLYPNGGGKEVLKEVTNWLKSQQCSSAERQVCGLNTLDEGIVSAIEEVVNVTTAAKKSASKNIIVKPQELYNPYLCKGCVIPDSKANFQLFDRVINVSHTLTVPLGRRGTIIGIRVADRLCDYVYEVVFDQEFFGGIKINCSPGRGYRMPPSALINISYGDRLYGKPRLPRKRINIDLVKNQVDSHLSSNNSSVSRTNRPTRNDHSFDDVPNGSPQFQILRKDGQPSSLNPPFYKNDSITSPQAINYSPHSSFLLQGTNVEKSSDKQFVVPKANHSNNRSSIGSSKAMPQPVEEMEYTAVWDGLLSKVNEKPSPAKHAIEKDAKQHGKPVTVQELFSAFEKQTEPRSVVDSTPSQLFSIPPSVPAPPQQKQVATMELLTCCTNLFGRPPTYSYNQLALNRWYIATIVLPDGRTISSVQCPTRVDATENAAEKALALLNGFNPLPYKNNPPPVSACAESYRNIFQPQRTPYQNVLSEYRMPFPNVQPISNRPPLCHTDGLAIRYPAVSIPAIPESFVKQNQMILAGHVPLTNVRHFIPSRTMPLLPPNNAPIKTNDTVAEENCLLKSKNVFVPLQVSRNSTKKPPQEANFDLLDSEWPSLYGTDKKTASLDAALPCLTPTSQNNSTEVKAVSLKTSPKEIILGKTVIAEKQNTVLTSPATSTASKPRKPRIAAMIPNLS